MSVKYSQSKGHLPSILWLSISGFEVPMNSFVLPVLIDLLAEQGISKTQLLENTDLDGVDLSRSQLFNAAQSDEVCGRAIALSGDRLLGIQLGTKLDMVSLGILGYALMTSATVGDVLKLMVRYKRALLPSMRIELIPGEGSVELRSAAPHLPQALEQFYKDALYAGLVTNLNLLTDNHGARAVLELDHGQPEDRAFYGSVFGSTIHFNSNRCGLTFDAESLAVTISTSDPVAQDVFRRECDRILANDNYSGAVSERVVQLLLLSRSEFPTAAAVAQQMYMSESTLQRRLGKEGSRYQLLLDQVRYRLALEYLQGTDLPGAEIAALLGFNNSANFRRSFKRWSGTTPVRIRQATHRIGGG
ncbi:AraC family transcriptional regulator [Porticoccaceae bacterium]|nr:AraC family transcriptional regulator [Porticoccaceae bacterium]